MSEENEDVVAEAMQEVVTPSEDNYEEEAQKETSREDADHQEKNWKEAQRVLREQQQRIQELEAATKPAVPKDEFESLDPDDVPTYGDVQKIFSKFQMEMMKTSMEAKHPEFNQVVEKYIPGLIKENPALTEAIRNSANPYLTAWQLATSTHAYHKDKESSLKNRVGKQVQENLAKPVSSNTVGKSSSLDHARDYENMTNEQIWEELQRNARRA